MCYVTTGASEEVETCAVSQGLTFRFHKYTYFNFYKIPFSMQCMRLVING